MAEIERKWLLDEKRIPDSLEFEKEFYIEQYYLAIDLGVEVRIRSKDENNNKKYILTIKAGSGLKREELEYQIDKSLFKRLKRFSNNRRICKTRKVTKNCKFEIDYYHDELFGLCVVEKEFNSVEESLNFKPPFWFGIELTNDSRFSNKNLAIKGNPLK